MHSMLKRAGAIIAVAAGAAFTAPVPANAQLMDLSTVTCEEFFEANEDDATLFMFWLDGWMAGQADDTTLDLAVLEEQVLEMAVICAQNPGLSVMNAAREVVED